MSSTDGHTRQIIDKDRQFVDFKIDRMHIEQETDRKTGQIINKNRQDAHWRREGQNRQDKRRTGQIRELLTKRQKGWTLEKRLTERQDRLITKIDRD